MCHKKGDDRFMLIIDCKQEAVCMTQLIFVLLWRKTDQAWRKPGLLWQNTSSALRKDGLNCARINWRCLPVVGKTSNDLYCVRFGLVTGDTDIEELLGLVYTTAKEVEESSKVRGVVTKAVTAV